MMILRRCWIPLIALVSTSAAAEIIVNGSFESPALGSTQNYFGAFSFTGWSGLSTGGAGNAGLVVGTDYGLSPFDGNQAFAFNGNNPAPGTYIEQTFSTAIGQSYAVTFGVGRNGETSSDALALQAQAFNAAGGALASVNATPPNANTYLTYGFLFTADSLTSRVRFTDVSRPNPFTDVFLDRVSVSAVPDAANTFALALVGLGALAIVRSRDWAKIRS